MGPQTNTGAVRWVLSSTLRISITNCQPSQQSIEQHTDTKQSKTDQALKSRDGLGCLRRVSISCWPFTPAVCSLSQSSMSWSWGTCTCQNREIVIGGKNDEFVCDGQYANLEQTRTYILWRCDQVLRRRKHPLPTGCSLSRSRKNGRTRSQSGVWIIVNKYEKR